MTHRNRKKKSESIFCLHLEKEEGERPQCIEIDGEENSHEEESGFPPLPRLGRILWAGEKERDESTGRSKVCENRDQGLDLEGYCG